MEQMRIIVRAPNWVGDCVLAIPALKSLRRGFPGAGIWVAARAGTAELFTVNGLADGTVALPEDNGWRGLRQASRTIKERSFDAGLLLTNSVGSALLFFFRGIPEPRGYAAAGRSFFIAPESPSAGVMPPAGARSS